MAPDHAVCNSAVRGTLFFSPPKGREIPMELIRLPRHQHPKPPHHELRQKRVLDSGYRSIGQVENLYVDEDIVLHFVDVATSGFMGLRTKHHLVPVEAIASEDPGSITLEVAQQAVESAPTYANPHAGPEEDLQRSTREHYGYN
jgi:PRC-barrel domain